MTAQKPAASNAAAPSVPSAMPAIPEMPAAPSADVDTDAQIAATLALADTAGRSSTVLFNYRRDNPDAPDAAQALNLEMVLDRRAIDLRTQAIRMLGAQVADAIAQMHDAAVQVDDFLAGVKATEARLTLASAVIALAAAALVGDADGILTAVLGVHDALKKAQA